MTNQEIESRLHVLVAQENAADAEIIRLLIKAEENKTYLVKYRDMWSWLAKEFRMSSGAIGRRVNAAKVAGAVAGVAEKIDEGQLNLSSLSMLQTIFNAEEKQSGNRVSVEQKKELVEKSVGLTKEETERLALGVFPKAKRKKKADQFRATSEQTSGVRIEIAKDKQARFDRMRELLSHKMPTATWSEIIVHAVDYYIKNEDPLEQAKIEFVKPQSSDPSAPLPERTRKFVLQRDGCACVICGSRFQVEVDHILCRTLGGTNDPANLRTLCRRHNSHAAETALGAERANAWRKSRDVARGEAPVEINKFGLNTK